jgi:hypothetical protein
VLFAICALSSCAGRAAWDITPPPTGQWPFDRFGNYSEEHADGRHPDADLYYDCLAQGIDIIEVSIRGANPPSD